MCHTYLAAFGEGLRDDNAHLKLSLSSLFRYDSGHKGVAGLVNLFPCLSCPLQALPLASRKLFFLLIVFHRIALRPCSGMVLRAIRRSNVRHELETCGFLKGGGTLGGQSGAIATGAGFVCRHSVSLRPPCRSHRVCQLARSEGMGSPLPASPLTTRGEGASYSSPKVRRAVPP